MKRAANLSVDADLLDEAEARNINLAQTLEEALRQKMRTQQSEQSQGEQWLEKNREAIKSYNEHIAKNGVFSDGLRRF